MISNQETQFIEKIGGGNPEQEFKIKASAASFQILSSGLYSNKIRAICRELFCNAYDSHKEAGTADTPFEVTLPTYLEPTFIIKDFGTGLSHDQVMTIYTTYFHSTKNESNEYIGQLGLGSKSPFSYTNNFIVESRQNGVMNVYSMFINESGTPAVSLLGSSDTDEGNGLTIKIPVKFGDFVRFRDESEETLIYFNPYPVVTGEHTRREFNYLIKKDGWAIRNEKLTYGTSYTPHIVQGFVRYPIDVHQLIQFNNPDLTLSESSKIILNSPIDFFVPIGAVQVAPSREHLSYDKKTIENLIKYVNQVAEDLKNSLQEMISDASSLWEARVIAGSFTRYDSIFRKLYENLINNKIKFSYNGTEISPNGFSLVDLEDHADMSVSLIKKSREYNMARYRAIEYTTTTSQHINLAKSRITLPFSNSLFIQVDNNVKIFVNDIALSQNKMRNYVKENLKVGDAIIELKPENKKANITAGIKEFVEKIGATGDSVVYASALRDEGFFETEKTTRVKVDRSMKPVFDKTNGRTLCDMSSWSKQKIDLSQGGYFVKFMKHRWVSTHENDRSQTRLSEIVKLLIRKKVLPDDVVIVGFNSIDYRKYSKNPLWKDVQDVFEEYLENNKKEIAKEYAMYSVRENNSFYGYTKTFLEGIVNRLDDDDHLITGIVKTNQMMYNMTSTKLVWYDSVHQYKNQNLKKEINELIDKEKKGIKVDLHQIYRKYPLLEVINNTGITEKSKHMNEVMKYIKMVDDEEAVEEKQELQII